ncbi:MAG: VRR-NUC domain-containing protein [Bacillota bacterium]|nr:VRR-NUC domain-containing protein [Bacillota bacterium]
MSYGRKESEDLHQMALFRWAESMQHLLPDLRYMYHTPNGGHRNEREGAKFKRMGVKPGVPDICLPAPRGQYHGLYIELKYGRNKTTASQVAYLDYLRQQGYGTAICYDWTAAAEIIVKYLKGEMRE